MYPETISLVFIVVVTIIALNMDMKKKWYNNSWFVLASLIIFFPAGLVIMWLYADWKKITKVIVTAIFGLLIVVGVMSPSPKTDTVVNTTAPTPKVQTEQKVPDFVFDVPSLVGKDIDGIRLLLGEPADGNLKEPTAQQISFGGKQWDNTFKKDGKELLVTYDVKTRKVVDFFISSDDSSGATKDTQHLMEMGNLKNNVSNYRIEFVKTFKDPTVFTGVKVIPQ